MAYPFISGAMILFIGFIFSLVELRVVNSKQAGKTASPKGTL